MSIVDKIRRRVEDELNATLEGQIVVRIDEEKDEMFICVKADGVDEFSMIFDHLFEQMFEGDALRSPSYFTLEFGAHYWKEISRKLRSKVFKK